MNSGGISRDGDDIHVELGGKAPVQPNFLLAQKAAAGESGRVHEFQLLRLLDLVGKAARQNDPRNMSLAQFKVSYGVRKCSGAQQFFDFKARDYAVFHVAMHASKPINIWISAHALRQLGATPAPGSR